VVADEAVDTYLHEAQFPQDLVKYGYQLVTNEIGAGGFSRVCSWLGDSARAE
jgi:hypothetical protein